MCDNSVENQWCDGKECTTASQCYNLVCDDGECNNISDAAADGLAAGILILIIIIVVICLCVVGCIVCCVCGVGFCAKKAAEAGAEAANR